MSLRLTWCSDRFRKVKLLLSSIHERIWVPLQQPWKAITGRNLLRFFSWIFGMCIIGLAGVWLPYALALLTNTSRDYLPQQIYGGALVSFSLAILAEGLVGLVTVEKAGSNDSALSIRGVAVALSLSLVFLLVGVMACEMPLADGPHVRLRYHGLLTLAAIALASYLFCFRHPDQWEKSVEDVRTEQDNDIESLQSQASRKCADGDVKL